MRHLRDSLRESVKINSSLAEGALQQGHRHIASNRALGGELLFSYVKSHLPEVTIKTHLSAQANVFIPDSTLEDFTCSFVVSWPSLKSKVLRQMLFPDCGEVCHLELIFNSYNID